MSGQVKPLSRYARLDLQSRIPPSGAIEEHLVEAPPELDSKVGATPVGEYLALVVRLQEAADGTWTVHIEGGEDGNGNAGRADHMRLVPLVLVVRLWRNSETGVLRGTVKLHGTDCQASFQSNAHLEELLTAWLKPSPPGGGRLPSTESMKG